jgi:sugar phosphate permease
MSLKVYFLTFSGMMLLYMMRAGYSFSKPYIRGQYVFTNFFLSLVDAFQFLGLGIAFMIKYKVFGQKYSIDKLKNHGIGMCIAYFLMPLLPLLHYDISAHFDAILLISSFVFGFLQFSFLPALSQEMKRYYTKDDHEAMHTCWDSGKHMGRIFGFLFMQLAVINLSIVWEVSMMIILGGMVVELALLYYYCVYNEA